MGLLGDVREKKREEERRERSEQREPPVNGVRSQANHLESGLNPNQGIPSPLMGEG